MNELIKLLGGQSAHSSKQINSFRYYENVVPVLKALIQTAL